VAPKNDHAFTLIELLVVIAIMAILASDLPGLPMYISNDVYHCQQAVENVSRPSHSDMFRSDADSDQKGWNAIQKPESCDQFDDHRRCDWCCPAEDVTDDSILQQQLQALRNPSRPFAPLLHPMEIFGCQTIVAQRGSKEIGGRHRVLNGQIDPDPTDRGHGVRSVANAQKTGSVPSEQTVDLDRQ
jgi:prepilin-type N-terminal cleavage/methylation domain-containing protein